MARQLGQDLLVDCTRCAELARIAKKAVERDMEAIASKLHAYNYKDRTKEVRDIRRKVERKRQEYDAATPKDRANLKEDYNPKDVEDAWGWRFVTLLQQESLEVLEELLDFAYRKKNDLRLRIVEIIVYSSRAPTDPLAINIMTDRVIEEFKEQHPETADVIKWSGPQNPESGYSSIHVIFALPVKFEFEAGPEEVETKFEVQIRDVFEDGWGELSHRLGYKRYDKGLSDKRELDRQLKSARFRELNALKASADAVSQHATLLDRSLSYFIDTAGFSGSQQSVSNIDDDLISMLEIIPAGSSELRALVGDAYRMMEAAHEASVRELDNAAPCEYYQSAANLFGKLIDELPVEFKNSRLKGKTGMPVDYHLQLERANALVRSVSPHVKVRTDKGAKNILEKAITFYRSLLETPAMENEYSQDATIHLRLGQALARAATNASQREQAIAILSQAQSMSRIDPQISRLNDDHWLALQAIYEITKLRFLSADKTKGADRLRNLEAAIGEGDTAVAKADEFVIRNSGHANIAHKIINNTLYYRLMLASAQKKDNQTIESEARERMTKYFEALLRRPYKRFVETHTETIDTLLRVALFLDQRGIALDMAERNVTKLRQVARVRLERQHLASDSVTISQVLDEQQYELYQFAMKVSNPLEDIDAPTDDSEWDD